MKILLVDASATNRSGLAHLLERCGARATACASGYEALAAFQADAPDMVFIDPSLPDLHGFEVVRQIRSLEPPGDWTPIVFLGSAQAESELEKGIAAGGDDFLVKPVSEAMLKAKLRALQRIIQMRTSLVVLAKKLDTANQRLLHLSSCDSLTGIANRRHFDSSLDREWRRARRSAESVTLILCDVDHFKLFNDTYGHQAGDDCLRQVAGVLSRAADRGGDTVARYGGEEFAILLPNTDSQGAVVVAEKARSLLNHLHVPHAASQLGHVTLSMGIASHHADAGHSPQTLIEEADRALYVAKHNGRDRVCRFDTGASRQFLQ